MAARIKTYSFIRKTHLYSGFILLAFLLMYFITGYILTHPNLITAKDPIESNEVYELNIPDNISIEELPLYIQQKFDIHGKRNKARTLATGEIIMEFVKPGLFHEITIAADGKSLSILKREFDLRRTLILYHRMEGYGGGWIYNLYIFMMDLSSLSLIVFAASGIYLWIKIERTLIWGAIFLLIGIIYTLTVMLSI
jgi:hypothetical protein